MASTWNDIWVIKGKGPVIEYEVDDRTTSGSGETFKPGQPLIVNASAPEYAVQAPTGAPEGASDEFLGISNKESSETSSANGWVEIATCLPLKTVLRGKATTTTNVDTQAEIDDLRGNFVSFDNSGTVGSEGTFTIDENEADDPDVHPLKIIDGDPATYKLDCFVSHMVYIDASR